MMNKRLVLSAFLLVAILSCSKSKIEVVKEVNVTFSYALPSSSGSMVRSASSDVYDSFYESYVKTRQVLPDVYALTVSDEEGKVVATLSGKWSAKDFTRLGVGKYHISGESKGGINYSEWYTKAPLLFDEDIEITSTTTNIILSAKYNCFLLLFDATNKSRFEWSADGSASSGISGSIPQLGDIYYLFPQYFKSNGSIKWEENGKENRIWMGGYEFKTGYYYYFDDMSGSFVIPKMDAGN